MRRRLVTAVIGAALFVAPAAYAQQTITVLSGGVSGIYYPLGVALGKIYGEKIPNVKTQVQATKASVEHLILLEQGRGEIAFTPGDSLKAGWDGDEDAGFKAKLGKLRAIGAIYPSYIQLVAAKDSGIMAVTDLKGKSLSVGAPKSGTELNTRAILRAAGMTYADIRKVEYLPFAEFVDLMKIRQLDATLQAAGLGVASLRDLSSAMEVTVVAIPKAIVARMGPPFIAAKIPANTDQGAGQGSRDGRRAELSCYAFRCAGRDSVPDDKAGVRIAAGTRQRSRRGQGNQTRNGAGGGADSAASGRRALLQGKGPQEVVGARVCMSVCFATGTIAKMLQVTALSLAWTHSVEKIEWQEDWRVSPHGLVLVEARIKGSGAGIDPPPDARLIAGWWSWNSTPVERSEVILGQSDAVGDWRICADGRCATLPEILGRPPRTEATRMSSCTAVGADNF